MPLSLTASATSTGTRHPCDPLSLTLNSSSVLGLWAPGRSPLFTTKMSAISKARLKHLNRVTAFRHGHYDCRMGKVHYRKLSLAYAGCLDQDRVIPKGVKHQHGLASCARKPT